MYTTLPFCHLYNLFYLYLDITYTAQYLVYGDMVLTSHISMHPITHNILCI